MRLTLLIIILLICHSAFGLVVVDSPFQENPTAMKLRVEMESRCPDLKHKVYDARVIRRLSDDYLLIELRQPVLVNGLEREAVWTARIREGDIQPGNRVSARVLRDSAVTFTQARLNPNQRWLSRLLSWIF